MLTVFTSLAALYALLASPGQGQVEANALRRGNAGHSSRQSHVIRGLLNVAGRDESFQRRQSGCDVGFFACADGAGCCPNGQTCDTLPDGSPACCCTTGGNCPTGQLPCSANVNVCCPNGDFCSSDGTCSPSGSGGGGGTGGGSGGSTVSGSTGGFGTTTSSSPAPETTVSGLGTTTSSSPALETTVSGFGGTTSSPLVVSTPVVATVTPTRTTVSIGSSETPTGTPAAPSAQPGVTNVVINADNPQITRSDGWTFGSSSCDPAQVSLKTNIADQWLTFITAANASTSTFASDNAHLIHHYEAASIYVDISTDQAALQMFVDGEIVSTSHSSSENFWIFVKQ
ncbi:hypothetical protein M378DRAFT_166903 [Amanita muscaria Koide BX008]|uniref:Uncharacterized protein n=1 Tax=Amanita muscaria (strain Koide BX008) TaxID=946122 RepID=A0A0C2SEH8_AMAMK|nr:hypothetical protein M378DRAFT_166903 [Amanita muscaria Koide BX008]